RGGGLAAGRRPPRGGRTPPAGTTHAARDGRRRAARTRARDRGTVPRFGFAPRAPDLGAAPRAGLGAAGEPRVRAGAVLVAVPAGAVPVDADARRADVPAAP